MHDLYGLEEIQTPRLILRPVALGDEHSIYRLTEHTSALLKQWMPWAQTISFERTCAFVQRGVEAWQSGLAEDLPMVMIRQADQAVMGVTGYNSSSDLRQGLYEIGYWCDQAYQGQGYVTESVNALTRYAFDGLGASRVIISMQIDNQKSKAVAERLNFAYVGQKERSPAECLPGQLPKNHVYCMQDTESLPDLHTSWVNHTADDQL